MVLGTERLLFKRLANAAFEYEIIFLVDNQSSGAYKGQQETHRHGGGTDANSSISSFQSQVEWRFHPAAALTVWY